MVIYKLKIKTSKSSAFRSHSSCGIYEEKNEIICQKGGIK